ncbi:TRAP transporter small permease [Defluviitalea phaphyphila]|uniref:TRAP transporter small permease n=1 Tax=Defluviitalea phaphyphila TaxID=1473580 RepID=UPI000730DB4E|nr:TRAP transporter small permease [Defluviitalea phaphyphila]
MGKIIHILYDIIIENVIKVIGIIMVLTILLQIFSRTFMKVPFAWTEELSRITFMWFCFLGSSIAMKKKAHLGIDYFANKFSKTAKFINEIIIYILIGCFGFALAFYGIQVTKIMHKQLASVLRIPMSYFYAVIPITGILFLILAVYFLIEMFKSKSHKM